MKKVCGFLIPYWKKGIIPVLFLLISTFISFVFPLFPKWAIDDVVIKKNYDKLLFLAIAFLVLILFQRLFSYLNEITFFKFQKRSILSIQRNLLKKVFYYPMEFFDKNHSGYLMGRIRGDVAGLSYIFSSGLVMFFMHIGARSPLLIYLIKYPCSYHFLSFFQSKKTTIFIFFISSSENCFITFNSGISRSFISISSL